MSNLYQKLYIYPVFNRFMQILYHVPIIHGFGKRAFKGIPPGIQTEIEKGLYNLMQPYYDIVQKELLEAYETMRFSKVYLDSCIFPHDTLATIEKPEFEHDPCKETALRILDFPGVRLMPTEDAAACLLAEVISNTEAEVGRRLPSEELSIEIMRDISRGFGSAFQSAFENLAKGERTYNPTRFRDKAIARNLTATLGSHENAVLFLGRHHSADEMIKKIWRDSDSYVFPCDPLFLEDCTQEYRQMILENFPDCKQKPI